MSAQLRTAAPMPGVIGVNTIIGAEIQDKHAQTLGTIHDALLDEASETLEFVILNFGGHFVGVNQRYYPVPWRALRGQASGRVYVIDIDRHALDAAPGCELSETGQWLADVSAARINQYYGAANPAQRAS